VQIEVEVCEQMHPVPERQKLTLQFVALLTSCVLGCSIQVQAQQNMEIGILRDGSLTLNRSPATPSMLRQQLVQMFRNRSSRVVYVRGDAGTEFRHVAKAIDIARGSGVDRTLVTTPLHRLDVPVSMVTTECPRATSLSVVRSETASTAPDADRDDALLVLITGTGDAYLGQLPLKLDDLVAVVKKTLTPRVDPLAPPVPPPPPGQPTIAHIKADSRAPYGRVLEVMDRLVTAGVNQVDFLSVITAVQRDNNTLEPEKLLAPPAPPRASSAQSPNAIPFRPGTPLHVSLGVLGGLLTSCVLPVYPTKAVTERQEGEIPVAVVVGPEGKIQEARTDGEGALQSAAVEAAKQWTFKPYLLNNSQTAVESRIIFRFELRQTQPGVGSTPACAK